MSDDERLGVHRAVGRVALVVPRSEHAETLRREIDEW
jgi:hypothetical protein